jgi:hypothetical protein
MKSIFQLLAVRKDAAFSNPFYLLEAKERSLTLNPLPRRWMGTWILFIVLCIVPFAIVLTSVADLAVQIYPAARDVAGLAYSPFLILFVFLSYGWSQRLAWRFSKSSEKSLHPSIKDIKPGRFHSTLIVETEEGTMTFVVQARHRILTRALDLAR